jgi:spore coat protein CotF
MQLTQAERVFLEDLKKHEELCVEKYPRYASQAQDPQLQQLFNQYGAVEQQHLNTINQILSGQQPNVSGGQGQQQGQFQAYPGQGQANMSISQDKMLCVDMVATEKNASTGYNSAIFEMANPVVRQALQHIQKEEQQHGAGISDYMMQHGMQ